MPLQCFAEEIFLKQRMCTRCKHVATVTLYEALSCICQGWQLTQHLFALKIAMLRVVQCAHLWNASPQATGAHHHSGVCRAEHSTTSCSSLLQLYAYQDILAGIGRPPATDTHGSAATAHMPVQMHRTVWLCRAPDCHMVSDDACWDDCRGTPFLSCKWQQHCTVGLGSSYHRCRGCLRLLSQRAHRHTATKRLRTGSASEYVAGQHCNIQNVCGDVPY
jgi:hypothetical protein